MKTYLELTRDKKTHVWEGDMPLVHEGQLINLRGVGTTRVVVHTLIVGGDIESAQRVICTP